MIGIGLGLWQATLRGAPGFDVYVDSINGDDGNDGLTQATALQTIAAAQAALFASGTSIGLVSGSYWRETFETPRDDFRIGVVGSGAAPVFDGTDIATGWTQPDVGTYPNVWAVSWVIEERSSVEYLGLWLNGEIPAFAANLADLQTNGGWHASSLIGTNPTVYVKSVADPNSSGDLYEISKRYTCIEAVELTGSGTLAALTGPIELKRVPADDGLIRAIKDSGDNAFAYSRLLLRDGINHHCVVNCRSLSDVIVRDLWPFAAGGGKTPVTWYMPDASGRSIVHDRVFVKGDNSTDTLGFLSHTTDTATLPDDLTLRQCYVGGLQIGFSASAESVILEGCYSEDTVQTLQVLAPMVSRRQLCKLPSAGASVYVDGGPVDDSLKAREFEHCAIYAATGGVGNGLWKLDYRNGTLTIRNCIVFAESTLNIIVLQEAPTIAGQFQLILEHNIIVMPTGGNGSFIDNGLSSLPFNIQSDHNLFIGQDFRAFVGGLGAMNGLAAWRAATGDDTNSVYLPAANRAAILAYFQGDPADGDFRLVPGIGTFVDGSSLNLAGPQLHWDWNTRAHADGASSRWPIIPANLTEDRQYISNPQGWDFYP